MKKKRIIFFHLYNDFSGSPRVLRQVIEAFVQYGYEVELFTSAGGGFLSDIEGIRTHTFHYRWTKNKVITAIRQLYAQAFMFFRGLTYAGKDVTFYINTITPFGAALAGHIMNKDVVYHVHETYIKPKLIHRVYMYLLKLCAKKEIFVSQHVHDFYHHTQKHSIVQHNQIDEHFLRRAQKFLRENPQKQGKNILMIASLKEYKGVFQFTALAQQMPDCDFVMVTNGTAQEVEHFFPSTIHAIKNLTIYPVQADVHPFYEKANLVLNLTVEEECIESFPTVLLEAQSYGLPCIAPTKGGPTEIITDGLNGFLVNSMNLDMLEEKVRIILNPNNYPAFSMNAQEKIKEFADSDEMFKAIERLIQ